MTTTTLDTNYNLYATIIVRRDIHENGMTLREYADGVVSNLHPILDHNTFTYQFGSTVEDMNVVEDFLLKNNFTIIESLRDSATIKITGTAEQFNLAFEIQMLQVIDFDRSYISHTGIIKIPTQLQDIILEVLGLDESIRITVTPGIAETNPQTVSDPLSVTLTPQQMANAYNFPASAGAGVCVGIIQFGGGYTVQNLTTSFAANGLSVPTIISYPAGNTNNPQNNTESAEVVLDSLIVGGTAPGAKQVVYFGNGTTIQGWVNLFNAAINDTTNNPSVLSVSWATPEASYWLTTMDPVLQSAVVKGITIVAASGDYGTKGLASTTNPTVCYPAVSPYVLACGGTSLQLNANGTIANEFVWNQGNASSGSGISTIYNRPSWQDSLTSKAYPGGAIAVLPRRTIPDVGGNADPATGAVMYYGLSNIVTTTGGTSATAPLWAGLIARIVALKGSNLGYINPTIYTNSTIFNDITQGNNAVPDIGVPTGYLATIGWDACTGLGSPIGQLLYNLFANNGIKAKVSTSTWQSVKNIKVKTNTSTWTTVNKVWTKTDTGWQQVY